MRLVVSTLTLYRLAMGSSSVSRRSLFRVVYAHIFQLTATSRQIFAFSRDGGFPLSSWLYHVDHRVYAPVRCVWFAVAVAVLLGLLAFAGPNAIGSIFSLAVVSQYVSFIIPITARHLGGEKISPGPFHLGIFVCVRCLVTHSSATNYHHVRRACPSQPSQCCSWRS